MERETAFLSLMVLVVPLSLAHPTHSDQDKRTDVAEGIKVLSPQDGATVKLPGKSSEMNVSIRFNSSFYHSRKPVEVYVAIFDSDFNQMYLISGKNASAEGVQKINLSPNRSRIAETLKLNQSLTLRAELQFKSESFNQSMAIREVRFNVSKDLKSDKKGLLGFILSFLPL